jgi:hypothetical protein
MCRYFVDLVADDVTALPQQIMLAAHSGKVHDRQVVPAAGAAEAWVTLLVMDISNYQCNK